MPRKDRPIYTDEHGQRRFRGNAVVRFLLDEASEGRKCSLNELWLHVGPRSPRSPSFSHADWHEFYQLIGYSLCGYSEIFPRSKERR